MQKIKTKPIMVIFLPAGRDMIEPGKESLITRLFVTHMKGRSHPVQGATPSNHAKQWYCIVHKSGESPTGLFTGTNFSNV
jgi:hypothetical protein